MPSGCGWWGTAPRCSCCAAAQPGTVLDDFTPVAQAQSTGEVVTLRPSIPLHQRYLLIWLTRLPLAPDGADYVGGIADIEVHSS